LSKGTHEKKLQQPPLQLDCPVPQPGPQTWFVWHASGAGQSVAPLHPQAPLTQAPPLGELVQLTHAPGGPQLVAVSAHWPASEAALESRAPSITTGESIDASAEAAELSASSAGSEESPVATSVASGAASELPGPPASLSSRPFESSPHAATPRIASAAYARARHAAFTGVPPERE
jgi:hypothetical protein